MENAMATKKAVKSKNPIRVGSAVLIRSVTLYYTGRIIEITKDEIVLDDAAWITDTGRFSDALVTGNLNEVEPFASPVAVGRGAIVDVTSWTQALPRVKK
jgi:acyl-CoA hydrolase